MRRGRRMGSGATKRNCQSPVTLVGSLNPSFRKSPNTPWRECEIARILELLTSPLDEVVPHRFVMHIVGIVFASRKVASLLREIETVS